MEDVQTSTAHPSPDLPSTSTSTSTTYSNYYCDVFINHRGPDVKTGFATALYRRLLSHRLQPFLDKEVLQKGEKIDSQIEGAIRTASIHIAIFSPGYAESPWCLNELLLILNKSGDTVIPVFYKVKPSDVRWATKDYARALDILEKKERCDPQTLTKWREALYQASNIVGFELEAYNGDEAKLLEEVVGFVLKKRVKTPLHVATHPTGLQEKVDDFEKTLLSQQQNSGKARVLGIVGMGGAGKTTLASELFNGKSSDFNKSFFLFEVRETARLTSLTSLQSKLLKGLTQKTDQIDSIEEGIEILRRYLSSLRALVVFDDVDHKDQLSAFMPITDVLHSDSLILVTSRYKDVLTSSGITVSLIYKLTGLNVQHSQQLFCSHAFLQPFPLPGFECLVKEFCKACDGLPLSLRVFGALLCGKNEKPYWEGILRQIRLPNEIKERLKISYDALEEDEKQIFLDIACYFIGKQRDTAINVWDGSGWNGLVGFRNLQDKCLVDVEVVNAAMYNGNDVNDYAYINVDDVNDSVIKMHFIKMHDHVRDLGREIADREKSSGITPHRLWRVIEDIDDLSNQSSVITEVRGIRTAFYGISESEESESEELFDQVLGKRKLTDRIPYCFTKLQLVETRGRDLKSIWRIVESPNLKWLRWTNCPYTSLPSWIPMKNLRVLEVEGRFFKTLWQAESQIPSKLRELYICNYSDYSGFQFPKYNERLKHIEKIVFKCGLQGLPDSFGCLTNLQHLDLSQCENLQGLPDSFGCLTNLQHLDLSYCESLQGLPDSFGCLTNLQHLDLSQCENLQGLPDSFGCLTNLQHLDLSQRLDISYCNGLQRLPDSFGCLTNLQHLYLSNCWSLQGLPDSFGCLTNLQHLDLSYCGSLQGLPDSFGCLTNLQHLNLSHCGSLQGLPDSFGCLTNLQHLYLSWSEDLEGLPDSFGCLTNLQHLYISWWENLQGLPDSFGCLTNLQHLHLSYCKSLQGLPDSFGCLTNLQHLDLSYCLSLQGLPDSFGCLTNLQHLYISWWENLQGLPDSFGCLTNLQHLDLSYCESLQGLPDSFGCLTNLQHLNLTYCWSLQGLPDSFGCLTNLQHLDLLYCGSLQGLPDSFGWLSANLQYLRLQYLRLIGVSLCLGVPKSTRAFRFQELCSSCGRRRKIDWLCDLTDLEEPNICMCLGVEELLRLERLKNLTKRHFL